MDLHLFPPEASNTKFEVAITGSKSESNRLLILQALYPLLEIDNLSNSDDTRVLKAGIQSDDDVIDIHHAGTAMRFLTAYLASKPGVSVLLTGSERMQQRPIGILVDALRSMGADIEFDQQPPVALDLPKVPTRDHIHTVVRTPNGNDYGKDLLRQHLADHPH